MSVVIAVRRFACGAVCLLAVISGGIARADAITFVPPNDSTGLVRSINDNDGYSLYRGDVFRVTADTKIHSVGIYQHLTDVLLTYKVWETVLTTGSVGAGATLLSSGSATVTTPDLQFIDFAFPELVLKSGHSYLVEFGFDGRSRENFFYDNRNVQFTQGNFQLIDGTQGGDTSNTVMPAIRLNGAVAAATPLPGVATAGLVLLGGMGIVRRFRRSPANRA